MEAVLVQPTRDDSQSTLTPSPNHVEIITDRFGRIVTVCDYSPAVFNLSARGLEGRALSAFVAHNRLAVIERLEAAAKGEDFVVETILRPRERKPRPAVLHISAVDSESSYTELR